MNNFIIWKLNFIQSIVFELEILFKVVVFLSLVKFSQKGKK